MMKIIQISTSSYYNPKDGVVCHAVYGLDEQGTLYELLKRRVEDEATKKMIEQKVWKEILTSNEFCK